MASDKILTDWMSTSIFPVLNSKFSVPIFLLTTSPKIVKTDSGLVFSRIGKNLLLFWITHWVKPKWSLRSTNNKFPWSLFLCNQPDKETVLPVSLSDNSEQLWVLYLFIN